MSDIISEEDNESEEEQGNASQVKYRPPLVKMSKGDSKKSSSGSESASSSYFNPFLNARSNGTESEQGTISGLTTQSRPKIDAVSGISIAFHAREYQANVRKNQPSSQNDESERDEVMSSRYNEYSASNVRFIE